MIPIQSVSSFILFSNSVVLSADGCRAGVAGGVPGPPAGAHHQARVDLEGEASGRGGGGRDHAGHIITCLLIIKRLVPLFLISCFLVHDTDMRRYITLWFHG